MDRKPSAPLYTGDDTASIHDDRDRVKASSNNCAGCLVSSLCITMLFLVIGAIGLSIWLFIFLPMDGKSGDGFVVINVNVTLDQQYLSDYRYNTSSQYRNLEREYITTLDEVIGMNDKFQRFYEETWISQIRRGSVIIVSWVSFNSSIGDSFDISDELRQEIIDTLSAETNDGRLGRLEGNVLNIRVSNPIDPEDQPDKPTRVPPATRDPQPPPTRDPQPIPTRDPRPPATDEPRPPVTDPQRPEDPLDTGVCGTRPGVASPQSRIVGGDETHIESMPWIGSLWHEDGFYTHGAVTLLNQYWAVTVAHVLFDNPSYVEFGRERLGDDSSGSSRNRIPISQFIPHPDYVYGSGSNDIALVRLGRPVQFSNQVRPACFSTSFNEHNTYRNCLTAGFGAETYYDYSSSGGNFFKLHQADVPLYSASECRRIYAQNSNVPEEVYVDNDQLCAGKLDGDGNACWGDNGIPLVCLGDDDLWHLVGVSISTLSCELPNFPTAFARISSYRNFIVQAIASTELCLAFNAMDCNEYQCVSGLDCVQGPCEGPGVFQCQIGPCIPASDQCNDVFNCFDNSDEVYCEEDCGEDYIYIQPDQSTELALPGYGITPYDNNLQCQWLVEVRDGRQILIEFIEVSLEKGLYDVLYIIDGDEIYTYEGSDDYLDDFVSSGSSIVIAFRSDNINTDRGFWLSLSDFNPVTEYCELNEFQCESGTLYCIRDSLVCDGEENCPNGDDEEFCPDDCGDEYVNLDPGGSYELTSVNYPNRYPDDSFCQWVFETLPGRQLLLQFSQFSLENGYDYLYISLGGIQDIYEYPQAMHNFTGDDLPPDLLSQGSIAVITMITDESSRDFGFVLQISDTDGSGISTCEDGLVIRSDSICDDIVDCPDNSDEAPCQCGDVGSDINLQTPLDTIHLTSINYPYGQYTNSLNCFWTVTATHGYRVFVHFNYFSLEQYADFLTISSNDQFYPLVSYTGDILPPDIESPSYFLYILFETDYSIGDSGFYVTISQTQPSGRRKCDNDLELYPDPALGGPCDGIPHCYDNSDEPEGCECGQDQFYLVPGREAVNLVSTNYPSKYQNDTVCQYTITTNHGYRILARFLQLDLEDGFDFIYIDAGDTLGTLLPYTGTITPDRKALDVISIGNTMIIYFETDGSVTKAGFKLQLTSHESDYSDNLLACSNAVQLLPEEYTCDNIYDCADASDEGGCVDIFETEICGTRPAIDPRRIINGEDAIEGEMPWAGQITLDGLDSFCGSTLLDEFWAITAAHCVADIIDTIYLVFGDLATGSRAPSTTHRQVVESALVFVHPEYSSSGYEDSADIALIRFKEPVKYSDYVRPACITASTDEPNEYQQCRVAGWGQANGVSFSYVLPSWLQTTIIPLLPLEECYQLWRDSFTSSGISSDAWFNDGGLLCAGFVDPPDVINACFGDSGSGLMCLGEDDRWHIVGVVSFGAYGCYEKPSVYQRVSKYRDDVWNTRHITESCLSSGSTDCLETIGCTGGSLCSFPQCGIGQFRCRTGICIPAEEVCDGYTDCYDLSDELPPYCYDECGNEDIYLSAGDIYTLTSLNYPDPYSNDLSCQWIVTSPYGTRIFAVFDFFHLEDGYDYLVIGYEPAEIPIGYPYGEYPAHSYTGHDLPPNFLSPRNILYATMTSDAAVTDDGFSMHFTYFADNEELPAVCGDNFQVFAGYSARCDGTEDCLDSSDEAQCVCTAPENLHIDPNSYVNLMSPNYPDFYFNSLSCTWIVTVRHGRHMLVSIIDISLDIETDALQLSSGTGIEGVFTYRNDDYKNLYFQTNEVVVHFKTDFYWNRGEGVFLAIYETNGDDCVASTNRNCVQREGCDEECYVEFCADGIEVYSESWFCDGYTDCSDKSDEPEFCECGERDIQLPSGSVYELSSPVSVLYPSTYRQSSNCQWVITTSAGYVLFAHFTTFDIEDGKEYEAHDGVLHGDYLYAGTGSSAQTYRRVSYTGSDTPLDLETPGNRLVLTFVTDSSITYDGFAVTILGRESQADLKCANDIEILRGDLLCNGVVDCYGPPTDEALCGAP